MTSVFDGCKRVPPLHHTPYLYMIHFLLFCFQHVVIHLLISGISVPRSRSIKEANKRTCVHAVCCFVMSTLPGPGLKHHLEKEETGEDRERSVRAANAGLLHVWQLLAHNSDPSAQSPRPDLLYCI